MNVSWAAVLGVCLSAACSDNGGFPDARPIDGPPPPGTVSLAWTVSDANGMPLPCDRINATSVTLELRNTSAAGGFTEVFSCSSGMGTTPAELPPGLYDISFSLTGPGTTLATSPKIRDIQVRSGQDTPLEAIAFAVDATGGFQLKLDANQTGGNCAPTASMGAGITGTTITLFHTGGDCAPLQLAIAAGATQPASNYTISCTAPTVAPCIEADQVVSVAGIDSGNYTIHVRGKKAALDCWRNDDTLQIPALGTALVNTLNLGPTGTPGC